MSDISSPESATASLTAVSAWAASGTSAERLTFEKPTPLTATLHRFSHIWAFLSLACGAAHPHPTLPHQGGGPGKARPRAPSPSMGEGWGGGDAALTPARRNCGKVMSSFNFSKTISTRRPTFASVYSDPNRLPAINAPGASSSSTMRSEEHTSELQSQSISYAVF